MSAESYIHRRRYFWSNAVAIFFIDGDDKNSLQLLVGWLGVSEVMDVMDGMRKSTNTTQQSTIYLAVTSGVGYAQEVKHGRSGEEL